MDPILFAQAGQPGGGGLMMFVPFILILVVFYFLLIRPQQRKQKTHQLMIENLDKGDRIVTAGGLYGTVVAVKEDRFVLKIAENVKIELIKNQVAHLVSNKKKEKKDS